MRSGNEKTSLKMLADFRASSDVSLSLSLSADGRWLAYGDGDSVFIGKWSNRPPHLSDVQEGPELPDLRVLEWSPDSKYLLAASDRIVYLVDPDHPTTSASAFSEIDELGIETIFWSYNSRFVVAADCCGAATLVFEVRGAVHWLPGVRRVGGKPLWALSPDCETLAMCTYQSQVGECLLAFSCEDWSLLWVIRYGLSTHTIAFHLKYMVAYTCVEVSAPYLGTIAKHISGKSKALRVPSKCTLVSGISWFPDCSAVLVWDSSARFCVDVFHPDGSPKLTLGPAKATADGVRALAVSPCNSLLALVDDNLQVHLYNTLIWRLVSVFDIRKPTSRQGDPPTWVPFLCWSPCSQYLVSASSTSPHFVVWSKIHGDYFRFDIGENSITDLAWHGRKAVLAVATGHRHLYLLRCPGSESSDEEIDFYQIRSSADVKELRWAGSSPSYLVVRESKDHVAVTCIR